jgi:uncharacterized protein YvpB
MAAGLGALAGPWSAQASMTLTTQATNWRILAVPQYHQEHGLSCEAAALRMALASLGIQRSEDTLLSQIGADRRTPYTNSSGFHWGDPYASFVGNVDGSERGLTGYGVYYPPIAAVAQADGASVSQSGEGIAPSTIYQAVLAGHPVIAWISFDWIYHRVSHYVAFDGRTVQFGSPYEHAAVVRGVSNGSVLINNPWFGVQWISKSTFESSYATFNDMAVIMGGAALGPGMSTASASVDASTVPQDTYHPLSPVRLFDTRDGTGGAPRQPVGPGQHVDIPVLGRGGVPASGADAVVLNVTVTDPTAAGFLTVYPSGIAWPGSSNLNWVARRTTANLVMVPIGPNGMVSALNSSGQANVVADVEGWYGPTGGATNAGLFNALPPARLLDTRSTGGPLGQAQSRTLQVTGRSGVPSSGVAAVTLNVTATDPTTSSYLTVFPTGAAGPSTSNLNFLAGQQLPNRVMVPVGAGGQITIFNALGQVNVVVDVNGWFTDDTSPAGGSRFAAITPHRIIDTRYGFGAIPDGGVAAVQFADTASIGVTAMVANVTAVDAAAPSYMTIWPDGSSQPVASDLNYTSGQTVPNLVVVKLGSGPGFNIYNHLGSCNLVVDLAGYYGPVGH